MGGVEHDTGDVDGAGVVEAVQHGFVQAAPSVGPGPAEELAVTARTWR